MRKNNSKHATFTTDRSHGIHPPQGVPQLYFDQRNVLPKHLDHIKQDQHIAQVNQLMAHHADEQHPATTAPDETMAQTFKLHQLKKRDDWPEWQKSRYKMLDQYREQGMFSEPMPLPKKATAFCMLWTYVLKICGTRKSRMVCEGNTSQCKHLMIGHTYANSLDSAGERLFWSLVASQGLIAIGADISNAFAEAPPPQEPLFMHIDNAFKEWWTEHLGNPPILVECTVVRVTTPASTPDSTKNSESYSFNKSTTLQ
jgi:hypothetical protein